MRRFAASVIIKDKRTRLVNHVVEIDNGVVKRCYPLLEEIESTQWIGGIIALSASNTISFSETSVYTFVEKYCDNINAMQLYAWHLSNIDVTKDSKLTKENVTLLQ